MPCTCRVRNVTWITCWIHVTLRHQRHPIRQATGYATEHVGMWNTKKSRTYKILDSFVMKLCDVISCACAHQMTQNARTKSAQRSSNVNEWQQIIGWTEKCTRFSCKLVIGTGLFGPNMYAHSIILSRETKNTWVIITAARNCVCDDAMMITHARSIILNHDATTTTTATTATTMTIRSIAFVTMRVRFVGSMSRKYVCTIYGFVVSLSMWFTIGHKFASLPANENCWG